MAIRLFESTRENLRENLPILKNEGLLGLAKSQAGEVKKEFGSGVDSLNMLLRGGSGLESSYIKRMGGVLPGQKPTRIMPVQPQDETISQPLLQKSTPIALDQNRTRDIRAEGARSFIDRYRGTPMQVVAQQQPVEPFASVRRAASMDAEQAQATPAPAAPPPVEQAQAAPVQETPAVQELSRTEELRKIIADNRAKLAAQQGQMLPEEQMRYDNLIAQGFAPNAARMVATGGKGGGATEQTQQALQGLQAGSTQQREAATQQAREERTMAQAELARPAEQAIASAERELAAEQAAQVEREKLASGEKVAQTQVAGEVAKARAAEQAKVELQKIQWGSEKAKLAMDKYVADIGKAKNAADARKPLQEAAGKIFANQNLGPAQMMSAFNALMSAFGSATGTQQPTQTGAVSDVASRNRQRFLSHYGTKSKEDTIAAINADQSIPQAEKQKRIAAAQSSFSA